MKKFFVLPALIATGLAFPEFARAQESGQVPNPSPDQPTNYEVLPHRAETRGRLWATEGAAYVNSENTSWANRFRLGGELLFGPQSRFAIGWTLIDVISSSGEFAASVGDISRSGMGPTFGYYLIPDTLWLKYTFEIQSVKGSRVSGSVTSYGHQGGIGYQFFANRSVSIGAQLDYLYVPSVSVPVLDVNVNMTGEAVYPRAHILSLSLLVGFDFG